MLTIIQFYKNIYITTHSTFSTYIRTEEKGLFNWFSSKIGTNFIDTVLAQFHGISQSKPYKGRTPYSETQMLFA